MFGFGRKPRTKEMQASLFRTLLARARGAGRMLLGRFDAAQTDDLNRKHWAGADGLSADAAANPSVRQTVRNRARYEVANNPILDGCIKSLADYVVGTGPKLQALLTDKALNRWIEAEFGQWCAAVGLNEKLHLARQTVAIDGEIFFRFVSNPALKTPVKLDLKLIEADQVATPGFAVLPANAVDGIIFDAAGNPQVYHVLKRHPGDTSGFSIASYLEKEDVPAELMIHWANIRRPGQSRGLPEIMPSLGLGAVLRRFIYAVLNAAEFVAGVAGFLKTPASADGDVEDAEDPTQWNGLALEVNTLVVGPKGTELQQVEAKQPVTTFVEFCREIINFMLRPLCMPRNIALGNSAQLNYSSGRLDHIPLKKRVIVERGPLEWRMMDRIFAAWFGEAVMIEYYAPQALRMRGVQVPHRYGWDPWGHVDPAKESAARETDLRTGMTSYPSEFAEQGKDWETEQQQQAAALGITIGELRQDLRNWLYRKESAPAAPSDRDGDDDAVAQENKARRDA